MKYEMRHAKKEDKRGKPAAEKKTIPTVKKKTIFTASGIMAGVTIIVLIVLNFQAIYAFMDSKMNFLTGILFNRNIEENKEAETFDASNEAGGHDARGVTGARDLLCPGSDVS